MVLSKSKRTLGIGLYFCTSTFVEYLHDFISATLFEKSEATNHLVFCALTRQHEPGFRVPRTLKLQELLFTRFLQLIVVCVSAAAKYKYLRGLGRSDVWKSHSCFEMWFLHTTIKQWLLLVNLSNTFCSKSMLNGLLIFKNSRWNETLQLLNQSESDWLAAISRESTFCEVKCLHK